MSDTGWVSGVGTYDSDGAGGQPARFRFYTLLFPQLGTYGIGDADVDTKVDFADPRVLAKNYNKPSAGIRASRTSTSAA